MRVALDGDAESSAQAQVCNFEGVCAVINQQVLGLQISVHYPVLVAMGYSFEQLVHEVLQVGDTVPMLLSLWQCLKIVLWLDNAGYILILDM